MLKVRRSPRDLAPLLASARLTWNTGGGGPPTGGIAELDIEAFDRNLTINLRTAMLGIAAERPEISNHSFFVA